MIPDKDQAKAFAGQVPRERLLVSAKDQRKRDEAVDFMNREFHTRLLAACAATKKQIDARSAVYPRGTLDGL